MAEKKHEQSGFKITDRRLFTSEGELRTEIPEEAEPPRVTPAPAAPTPPSTTAPPPAVDKAEGSTEMPALPTAAEQQAQVDAYQKSSKDLDSQVELG
jgi:hypothetical protein